VHAQCTSIFCLWVDGYHQAIVHNCQKMAEKASLKETLKRVWGHWQIARWH